MYERITLFVVNTLRYLIRIYLKLQTSFVRAYITTRAGIIHFTIALHGPSIPILS
jgi:hypothetical protein